MATKKKTKLGSKPPAGLRQARPMEATGGNRQAGVVSSSRAEGATAPSKGRTSPAAAKRTRSTLTTRAAARSAAAFEEFSLSKYRDAAPPNVVPPNGSASSVQRGVIERGLQNLSTGAALVGGMTLSLRPAALNAIASYDVGTGTVAAADVMKLFARLMNGSEFYAQGHPMATRVDLQAQARALIAAAIPKAPEK